MTHYEVRHIRCDSWLQNYHEGKSRDELRYFKDSLMMLNPYISFLVESHVCQLYRAIQCPQCPGDQLHVMMLYFNIDRRWTPCSEGWL